MYIYIYVQIHKMCFERQCTKVLQPALLQLRVLAGGGGDHPRCHELGHASVCAAYARRNWLEGTSMYIRGSMHVHHMYISIYVYVKMMSLVLTTCRCIYTHIYIYIYTYVCMYVCT